MIMLSILIFVFGIWRYILHYASVFWYRGKRKTVPLLTNPLLLKSATRLAQEIRDGKLTSEEVVQAYIDRIEEVEPYINATVDRCFEDALSKARNADSLIASGKYTKEQLAKEKPLLGVPLTVKILLTVKGLRSTGGSRVFEKVVASEDATCVTLMKEAGAIVLATTNSPEGGLSIDTCNFVHGCTRNPLDVNKTSGGSSGGESALISSGGSILGLGSDALGSVRIPAHFTGIFAHKPSRGLVPNSGLFPAYSSEASEYIYVGPMCRHAEDLIVSMKILSSRSEVPVAFGQQVNFKKLKILYLKEIITPFLAPVDKNIAEGLEKAVTYFGKQYGTVVKEIKMPFQSESTICIVSTLLHLLKDIKTVFATNDAKNFNETLDLLKLLIGKSNCTFTTLVLMNLAALPFWHRKDRILYYQTMVENWANEFDGLLEEDTVLLMPTFPVTSPYITELLPFYLSFTYTAIFNIIGLPATQCPIGYNEEGFPYGIQVVGRANKDDLVIACAVELEKAFGGWKIPL